MKNILIGRTSDEIANWYLEQYPDIGGNDPLDDVIRLVLIAIKSESGVKRVSSEFTQWLRDIDESGTNKEQTSSSLDGFLDSFLENNLRHLLPTEQKHGTLVEKLVNYAARRCFAFCNEVSLQTWELAIETILTRKYGGREVYLKKKNKLTPQDVARLTPKQITDKYGVSRAYAYRLLKRK